MALTVLVTAADGRVQRFGPDEPDGGWVPQNITFGTALPGGFKEGSFTLPRRATEDFPLRLLDEVRIIDEAGITVYEGRIQQLPRETGDGFSVTVNCLGWAAHLLDDTSFSVIFRDMDLTRWSGPALGRRQALGNAGFQITDPSVVPDEATQSPALTTALSGPWDAAGAAAPAWYDAGSGNTIGSLYYAWKRSTTINAADANWTWQIRAAVHDDLSGGTDDTASLRAVGPGTGTLTTTANNKRFLQAQLSYAVASPANQDFAIYWTTLAVHGNHGLAKQGTEPNAGYYIDDMLGYALSRAAPKLNFSLGVTGSIQKPGVIISQAAYPEPGSVENVILDLNKYVLWDWMVYDNRTFFYRPTDPERLTWEARLDEGIHLSLEGDDAEHAYNGCMVKYTFVDGTAKVAGPVGSGFDVESPLLGDLSPDSTVNQHGYPRKWLPLKIEFPILDQYPPIIGSAYLFQAALPARSGNIELTGQIRHPTKGLRPVREVRAGDWIRLAHDDVPRRIVQTSYSHDTLTNTVTVGNDVDKISALLEQLGVLTTLKLG